MACLPEVETIDPSTIVEWQNYTSTNGLAGNQVNAITADSEGNLWIGTDNGVSKFDGTNFTTYRTAQGLLDNYVSSIVEFTPGVMVFGTDSGLTIFENGVWIANDTELDGEITPPYSVYSMGVDSDGLGWLGTSYGLYVTDGVEYRSVWDPNCYECNYVNYIYLDSNDLLWLGTDGDLESYPGWQRYNTSDGLPHNSIQSIYEDSWGTLWVGTKDGLAKRAGSGFETVSLYNSAQQNQVQTINQDTKGDVWFSSIGNGLIYSNGSSMRTDPESVSNPMSPTLRPTLKSTISSFSDNKGALWFGTLEGGLWKYTPK